MHNRHTDTVFSTTLKLLYRSVAAWVSPSFVYLSMSADVLTEPKCIHSLSIVWGRFQ